MNSTDSEDVLLNNITKNYTAKDLFEENASTFNFCLTILQFFAFTINLFHMAVLTRKEMRSNAIYRLMIGICSFDLVSQVSTFLIWSPFWIRSGSPETACFTSKTYMDALFYLLLVPLLDLVQRCSSWLALFMALCRTLAVAFPLSSTIQTMTNPRSSIFLILAIFTISTVWEVIVCYRYVIVEQMADFGCNGELMKLEKTRYEVVMPKEYSASHRRVLIVYGIIKSLPSLIDPILTVLLIIELRRASKRRKNIKNDEADKSNSTTKIVLFMTVSFFILEVPNGFSHIAAGLFNTNKAVMEVVYAVSGFSEVFPASNSASHVFVCLLLSSQYRDTARSILGLSKPHVTFVAESRTVSKSSV